MPLKKGGRAPPGARGLKPEDRGRRLPVDGCRAPPGARGLKQNQARMGEY